MRFERLDEAIAAYLRRKGITQAAFAESIGMSENTLSWKRRGIREFSLSEAVKVCDIVGITLDEACGRCERKAG